MVANLKNQLIMQQISLLAPAKLNLYLGILGKQANGYHSLQTLFAFTNLADHLSFSTTSNQGEIQLNLPEQFANFAVEDNLIYQAAQLLQPLANQPLGITISLEKNLPLGSGLGGGSSNAATTLIALNKLWNIHLSRAELAQLGLQLGADVPIFIYGQAAWAEGVGEKFSPAKIEPAHYLLLYPGLSCSTQQLFSHPDLIRNSPYLAKEQLNQTEFIKKQFIQQHLGYNAFTPLVKQLYPAINHSFNWLTEQGLTGYLTGSGSCIYAQVTSQQQAEELALAYKEFMANLLPEQTTALDKQTNLNQPQAWAIQTQQENMAYQTVQR